MRLLIVHPSMPQYRLPFMQRLPSLLRSLGIELVVAHGAAVGSMRARLDTVTESNMISLTTRELQVWPGKTIIYREIDSLVDSVRPDAVILEQALHNLETWRLLLHPRFRRLNFAFWGHGRTYSTSQTPIEATVKQWMTRRGNWFFAYTKSGAEHVIKCGFPSNQVTILNNSFDTRALRRDFENQSDIGLAKFREFHGLTPGKTALYIGGIDHVKGIPWLLDTARLMVRQDRQFRLLMAGTGELKSFAQSAAASGGAIYLGPLTGSDKAQALAAADVLLIPRWIGLVALDSLVSGKPIATTIHPSHAPEFDYLEPGRTVLVTPDEKQAYADGVLSLLGNPTKLAYMQSQCFHDSEQYSLEAMLEHFVEGVKTWSAHW